MSDPLATVLYEPLVQTPASPRSFERGVIYLEDGRVGPVRASAGRAAATVQGADSYSVELSAEDGRLRFACSCPIGLDGTFCKHCVAVALRWLRDHGPLMPTLDDARAHLETLSPEALVELLIDHAHDDEGLARKLLLMATRQASGESADMGSMRARSAAFGYFQSSARTVRPRVGRTKLPSSAGAAAKRISCARRSTSAASNRR
jgi:uncharacterized Zn finger protein